MKKLCQSVFICLIIYSCGTTRTTEKQGELILGENGKIESGKINLVCSKPLVKTYTKGLELKVDAEMEQLNSIPKSKLDVELKRSVVKLAQYTSEGLDRDLVLHRVCQIANNGQYSEEGTRNLLEIALGTYNEEVKKKSQQ